VQPPGWREAAGTFGEPGTFCSVADICDEDSLGRVRAYKQQLKAAAKGAPAKPPGGAAQAAGGGTKAKAKSR